MIARMVYVRIYILQGGRGEVGIAGRTIPQSWAFHVLPQVVNIMRLYLTLIAYIPNIWIVDVRIGERGGSDDCRQDNPSKLSSAFAKYCILPTTSSSSLPSAIQTRNRRVKVIRITCKNSCIAHNPTKCAEEWCVGNAQRAVWEDLRDAGLAWHVNCK